MFLRSGASVRCGGSALLSIGSFILIKNELFWIGPHLANWLPHLDQMVLFDGNSTDGTLEVIKDFQSHHPCGYKIKLVEDRDPKDLRDDYVRLFNEALQAVDCDLAFFLHPDMVAENPEAVRSMPRDGIAYSTRMISFAGEPDGQLYRINGRGEAWKNIYRRRNPDLGAHYHGWYGAWNEDVYFEAITGDSHDHWGSDFSRYPYHVVESGLRVHHYSDVRHYQRRLDRMAKCLVNQDSAIHQQKALAIALEHPRVTLKDGDGFTFESAEYHPIFKTWKETLSVHA